MIRWLFFILALTPVVYGLGCSQNNVGDLFPPFGSEGDPGDDGFNPPPGGGTEDPTFIVHNLQAGTLFAGGPPELLAHYPEQGAAGVDADTFIVLKFNESMNPKASILLEGFKVRRLSPNLEVKGKRSVAAGSADRILVFEPDDPLEEQVEYEVSVTSALQDVQGESYAPAEGGPATTFRFTVGKSGDEIPFEIIEPLTTPAPGATGVSDGASVLVFFTEAVDKTNSDTGLGGSSENFTVQDEDGKPVLGGRKFKYDDRLLVFTPSSPMPGAKEIDVTVKGGAENGDGSESLGQDFSFAFTVVSFPRVTAITFPDNDPLVVPPASIYEGRINLANQKSLKVVVTLTGLKNASRITLLLWDGISKAIIVVLQGQLTSGDHAFTIDVKPGLEEALPDGKITVGAYTTGDSANSPVGPALELPHLKKDVKKPGLVSLGPPHGTAAGGLDLLTEINDPGIHGRASESLSDLKVNADFLGTPLEAREGIKFFSMEYPAGSGIFSDVVTRGGDHLFVTPPLLDLGTVGRSAALRGRQAAAPIQITKIKLTDLVGNTRTYSDSAGATGDFRGYFYSLGAGIVEVDLICYDRTNLEPLEDVDLIVENVPLGQRWATHTDQEGAANFASLPGSLLDDRMVLTAVKDGYRIQSLVWSYSFKHLLISLPLTPQDPADLESPVKVTIGNPTGSSPEVFFGGNELISGTDEVLVNAMYNPLLPVADLQAGRNRLQFLEGLGVDVGTPERYQWAWSNPIVPDSLSGGQPELEAVVFSENLKEPDPDEVQPVVFADKLGAGATSQARVAAALPGFAKTLPLGVDLTGALTAGDLRFDVPLPPSLFINEAITEPLEDADLDPPYELVIEPELGPAANDSLSPDTSLFEKYLSIEGEQIGDPAVPHPVIVRKRIPYLQAEVGLERTIDLPDPVPDPATNPPTFQFTWLNVLDAFDPGNQKAGAYALHLGNADASRAWDVLMSLSAAGLQANADFEYPNLNLYGGLPGLSGDNDFTAFDGSGDYPFDLEAYHADGLDLANGFFSDLERYWETYWRSGRVSVTKP